MRSHAEGVKGPAYSMCVCVCVGWVCPVQAQGASFLARCLFSICMRDDKLDHLCVVQLQR